MVSHLIFIQIIFLYISSTFAHLCLWQPMQRGNFSLNPPRSHDCDRTIGPCGDFNSSTSKNRTILQAGSFYTVLFQQHLNHYYSPNPGQLDISFAIGLDPEEKDFHILTSFNDYNPMNPNTQTNFSIPIQLPNEICDHCVLRVRYLTNNQEKTFYQCSDIKLTKPSQNFTEPILKELPLIKHENNSHDCCAPLSFQMSFIHWMPDAIYTSLGRIYYDKYLQQIYISMLVMNIEYNIWMNFTSHIQYINNVNEETCYSFSLDSWNDWCYGNTYNQLEDFLSFNKTCLSDEYNFCNQWQNGDFLFESTTSQCFPSSLIRLSNDERTLYFDQISGLIPAGIFRPDSICFS